MLAFLQSALVYLIAAPVLLTIVVTIHEMGHFLTAKAFGVAVDRFSIGFGKAIASWTDKSGVQWRIGWIPLGGYVRFAGDSNDASLPDREELAKLRAEIEEKLGKEEVARFFHFKPLWQRALVVVAGPLANFVLAVVIFTGIFSTYGLPVLKPRVGEVSAASPAAEAGFRPGDLILTADGRPMRAFDDVTRLVRLSSDRPIVFSVQRGAETIAITATPRRQEIKDWLTGTTSRLGLLGISPSRAREDREAIKFTVPQAFVEGIHQTGATLDNTLRYLGRIVTGKENGRELSGPIGIAHVSGAVAKVSMQDAPSIQAAAINVSLNLINLAAALSIGIGFVNLLPIPVLDGGHLAFYAYEALARRPVGANVQMASYRVGLALVLGLMLFATWNDLQRLQAFQFLGGLLS